MSEQDTPGAVTADELRALYNRLGLHPSDEEIAAALPAVQRLYDNDRLLEARLTPEVEPVPAPRLRPAGDGVGVSDGR